MAKTDETTTVEPTVEPKNETVLAGTAAIAEVPGEVSVEYPKVDGGSVVLKIKTH